MICAYCKSDIDNDSFHCDQCGKEVFLCPNCNQFKKGKHCEEDQGKLYSPKQQFNTGNSTNPTSNNASILSSKSIFEGIPQQAAKINSVSSIPVLRIINYNLKIDIEIKDKSVLGRTVGDYVNLFAGFSDISGKHLEFEYSSSQGWLVRDTGSDNNGSTFGTKISTTTNWDKVSKLTPNTPTPLQNNTYLLIADKYEFRISISINLSTPTGTQRK